MTSEGEPLRDRPVSAWTKQKWGTMPKSGDTQTRLGCTARKICKCRRTCTSQFAASAVATRFMKGVEKLA